MSRVKTGTVRRRAHKRILARTKGFRMTKNRLVKVAIEADLHAGQYAYHGRKLRKRDFRSLWITRLSTALKNIDEKLNYSSFIKSLKNKNVILDRKVLADIAVNDYSAFKKIVEFVQK
ncbi:50S ribosomal protein L20 [Candidatus Cerribacteria bacterium 'Amazon FNV 2010 28 9']|uniref:Large ribosomal subunit protein bL20 n=1 Tax=Candidatus Cerribacteria bacterium 'Amazon FNV 2010 28 9' TaxID=2081795 RepID=A0A317JTR8_9BACT|nr:MAG: 50S ribosomal protein L20 [Candidatus Cerribacteria bacterium 'Amazon FNV 2010 28 9']